MRKSALSDNPKVPKKPNFLKRFFAHNPNYDVQNKELVTYCLGVAGQNHTYNLVGGWFEYFCNFVLFIKPIHTGILLGAMRGWDAVNDPLAGAIIDGHTFKSGDKLKPYLKIFAIPIGVLAMLIFINFGFQAYAAKIAYVATMYFLWDSFYSFQDTAQWGLVARISNMPERRVKAAYWGRMGGTFGGLLPGLISPVVGLVLDGIIPINLTQLFIFLGVFFGLGGMIISLAQVKVVERAPNKPPDGKLLGGVKLLAKNKIVLLIALGNILNSAILNLSQMYFFQTMVRLNIGEQIFNGATILLPYQIISGVPGFVAMMFTPFLAKKLGGMQRVLITSSAANIIGRVLMFFIGYEGWRIVGMALIQAFISIPSGMVSIATTALWSESVDYTEWKTGKRNEGTVFSMQNFLAKITGSISSVFSGLTLTLLKFDPKKFVENPNAPLSVEFTKYAWLIHSLAPAVGSFMQIIPLLLLKFTPAERELMQKELEENRAEESRKELQKISDGLGFDYKEYIESNYSENDEIENNEHEEDDQ
jgi:Na+/melibiose symporter-like transporter